jgi:RHS repeat-associated protein
MIYDTSGQLLAEVDPLGHPTTYRYDHLGRVTRITDALGHATITTYTADADTNVKVVTDALDRDTTYRYDDLGRLAAVTDALGRTTTMDYDPVGNLSHTIDPLGHTTTYGYDADDRLTTTTDALAHTTTTSYDQAGNVESILDPAGYTTTYEYDPLNRQSSVTLPESNPSITQYDANGNVSKTIDPAGSETTYEYDAVNRPTVVRDADGNRTVTAYDEDGNDRSVTDGAGNTTSYGYDAADRRTSMTDPLHLTTVYVYDAADRLTEVEDRDGRQTLIGYDDADRQTSVSWYDNSDTLVDQSTYTYDAANELKTASNHAGTVTLDYDAAGRVAGQTDVFGLSLTYGYDGAGRLASVRDSLGGTATSTYYDDNRLKSRTLDNGVAGVLRVDLAYDPRGLPTTIYDSQDPNGTTSLIIRNATYDGQGRTRTIGYVDNVVSTPASPVLVDSLAYAYDTSGRLQAQNRLARSVAADGSILAPQQTNNAFTSNLGTTFTPSGQIATATTTDGSGASTSVTYAYDGNGNVRSITTNGQASTPTTPTIGPGNQISEDGTWSYEYDGEGNVVEQTRLTTGDAWLYSYDNANHLTDVQHRQTFNGPLLDEVVYTYDALGRLVERRALAYTPGNPSAPPSVADTRFAVDAGGDVWADLAYSDGSTSIRERYLRGDDVDQVFAREDAQGNAQWYLTDRLGSVIDLVDSNGAVRQRAGYSATGVSTVANYGSPLSFASNILFTGKYTDPVTKLQYNGARWYDPASGRWLSPDPSGFGGGDANLYRYAGNDPTDATDPSGLWAWVDDAVALGGGALVGVASQGVGDLIHGRLSSWEDYAGAAAGGAAFGETMLYTANPWLAGAAAGAAGNATTQVLRYFSGKQDSFDVNGFAVSTASGFVGGGVGARTFGALAGPSGQATFRAIAGAGVAGGGFRRGQILFLVFA